MKIKIIPKICDKNYIIGWDDDLITYYVIKIDNYITDSWSKNHLIGDRVKYGRKNYTEIIRFNLDEGNEMVYKLNFIEKTEDYYLIDYSDVEDWDKE